MLIELIKAVALLLALSLLQSVNIRVLHNRPRLQQAAAGLIFGAIAVAGMLSSTVVRPGLILDIRSAVLSMAGLFGGPVVGGVAALMAGSYRLWLGGVGALAGLAVVLVSTAFGLLYRMAHKRSGVKIGLWQLLAFSVLMHGLEFLLLGLLPSELVPQVLAEMTPARILALTSATVGLGLLLQDGERRHDTELALRESEARFRNLLQDIPGVSVQGYAPDGTTTYWNKASEDVYGYTAAQAIGKNLLDLIIPPAMHEGVRGAMREMFLTQQPIPAGELSLLRRDGSTVPVFSSHALVQLQGRDPEMFCIDIDLTERYRAQAELRIAATAFEAQEGIVVTDPDLRILRVNKAFTEIFDRRDAQTVGQLLIAIIFSPEHHDASFLAQLRQKLTEEGHWAGEVWSPRLGNEIIPLAMSFTAVLNHQAQVSHYVVTMQDITQKKAAEAQIRQLAFFDALTHLPNRRLLMDRLQRALASSERSQRSGAVLFIDLDHFKTINDTLGHEKGDVLLRQVGDRLLASVREGDTVARLGGDEFVLMLEDLDGAHDVAAAEAMAIGEKIMRVLSEAYQLVDLDYHSTPSIGVAMFNGHLVSVDDLLKQADLAMYQAKAAGRNALRFFDPAMQAAVNERAALEADLRLGILAAQFSLHFQSQVDALGQIKGAEALLRWSHPVRGMVSPAYFIPLAEETGLILPLGNWVLEHACQLLVEWADRPDRAHLSLAVNVSARQFRERDFAPRLLGLLARTGANPSRLKLELTESMLVANLEDIITKMTTLRQCGIRFSLDDFGTGYSSLSYLKRLPLSQLKIDQSFVRDILSDPNDAAIAKTVVTLGHSLGLTVIAEGVETEAQRRFLAHHGCNAYQGYLFSRPLPLPEFEQLLDASVRLPVSFT